MYTSYLWVTSNRFKSAQWFQIQELLSGLCDLCGMPQRYFNWIACDLVRNLKTQHATFDNLAIYYNNFLFALNFQTDWKAIIKM